jgi:hypothetical protein
VGDGGEKGGGWGRAAVLTRAHADAPPQHLHRHARAKQAQLTLVGIAHDRENFCYREDFSLV